MPLSPFRARAALIAFLTICGGVAWNLLAMQEPRGQAYYGTATTHRAQLTMDAARLDRLAGEASGGRTGVFAGGDSRVEAKRPRLADAHSGELHVGESMGSGQRVGRFAPSSGHLSPVTLPGVDPAESRRATVRAVQAELARRGYESGAANGVTGLVTRAAVLAYEHDQGLPLTAEPSPEILAHLRHGTSAPGAAVGIESGALPPTGHAEAVIRSVQQSLGALGYLAASADGIATDETVRAIREFEMDAGLVPTGRISGPLIARLTKAQSRGKGEARQQAPTAVR